MREQTLGVVDIGSNTVHLLVARTDGATLTSLADESVGLGLGSDIDSDGTISVEKGQGLVETLQGFQETAWRAGVDRLHLLATYAVRAASNRDKICAAILEWTGLPVEVLPPEQEAEFSFMGAQAFYPGIGPRVVVDIGGGSMQVAVGDDGKMLDSVSLPLGATRVANRFLPSDPPTPVEEAMLVTYLARLIPTALPLPGTRVRTAIGVGGTLRRTPQLLGLSPGDLFPSDGLEQTIEKLRGHRAAEIVTLYDLRLERARILLPAALVLREALRGYGNPPLVMSGYGLREGAILSLARRGELVRV